MLRQRWTIVYHVSSSPRHDIRFPRTKCNQNGTLCHGQLGIYFLFLRSWWQFDFGLFCKILHKIIKTPSIRDFCKRTSQNITRYYDDDVKISHDNIDKAFMCYNGFISTTRSCVKSNFRWRKKCIKIFIHYCVSCLRPCSFRSIRYHWKID
jgi:hypothetical protein